MVELPSFPSFEWDFLVIDTSKGEDLMLGYDFLDHFNPSVYWRQGLITFNSDLKDYYDPFKFSIQDFGEDDSISSFHLFVGNMDLPPLSYNDYLEELWVKEE
ncbi:hypothetical protein O181_018540 [Austropuccinia psidii MF-1]|uniref:Uncharacterized protein n=1 Tax=Austropuccinia psidii MF-1 TaxID=1389203 RepID=A0A9Q3GU54_9BASI|nr:hypothetical protein [Austropuccinia psidii MF-1]